MKDSIGRIEGVLFDIDGVVHVGKTAIPGAADALRHLDRKSTPYRFVTNTTTKSPRTLHERMQAMGLPIADPGLILTTHEVAAAWLRARGCPSCLLLVNDDARETYGGLPTSNDRPDYVVIGDIGDAWNYDILDRVFNMVMDGAAMLALHKGRYRQTENGLRMDIGAFVAGLEYTTGRTATIVGKPSSAFFDMAVQRLGVAKDRVVMVGDDIESDIGGAQNAGIRGILVRTGKYREDAAAQSAVRPDAVIDSVADLIQMI